MAPFRQLEDRQLSVAVSLMKWSPKMDLIALVLVNGDVSLHRLKWQRVWLYSGGDNAVTTLEWSPDGKILAVAHNNSDISFCHVETGDVLRKIVCASGHATALSWVCNPDSLKPPDSVTAAQTFLSELPPLAKSSQSSKNAVKDSFNANEPFTILAIGSSEGDVFLYAYGELLLAKFSLGTGSVVSVCMSSKLETISCVVSQDKRRTLKVVGLPIFSEKLVEIQTFSWIAHRMMYLTSYLNTAMKILRESWEDLLLEVDTKLKLFDKEKKRRDGWEISLGDEFLEVMMFGRTSVELEKFLLQDLTAKGVKKLGHSVQMCYVNIQQILERHVHAAAKTLFFHANELLGYASWDSFSEVGVSVESVSRLTNTIAAFVLKCVEFQQVIEVNITDFKSTIRYLYVVIMRLSGDSFPSDMAWSTDKDLKSFYSYVTDNLLDDSDTFSLDRVGQYLRDEPLKRPLAEKKCEEWRELLGDAGLRDLLFQDNPTASVLQEHNRLNEDVSRVFAHSMLDKACAVRLELALIDNTAGVNVSQCCQEGNILLLQLPEDHGTDLYAVSIKNNDVFASRMVLTEECVGTPGQSSKSTDGNTMQFCGAEIFDENTISLLVHGSSGFPKLIQFPITNLRFRSVTSGQQLYNLEPIDYSETIEKGTFRFIEGTPRGGVAALSVSGSRHVGAILFASRRRIRLYEMDDEDDVQDEDEDEEEVEAMDSFLETSTDNNTTSASQS